MSRARSSATRRLGVFAAVMGSYWVFVRWYERRPVRELRVEWQWILAGAVAGSLSIAAPIALLYASGLSLVICLALWRLARAMDSTFPRPAPVIA
jgi:hypothetical protein